MNPYMNQEARREGRDFLAPSVIEGREPPMAIKSAIGGYCRFIGMPSLGKVSVAWPL
jgi:hypothetical protein